MSKNIEFMDFWQALCQLAEARGVEPPRYGEAKDRWNAVPTAELTSWRRVTNRIDEEAKA